MSNRVEGAVEDARPVVGGIRCHVEDCADFGKVGEWPKVTTKMGKGCETS